MEQQLKLDLETLGIEETQEITKTLFKARQGNSTMLPFHTGVI